MLPLTNKKDIAIMGRLAVIASLLNHDTHKKKRTVYCKSSHNISSESCWVCMPSKQPV
jgi:hypothetical protein